MLREAWHKPFAGPVMVGATMTLTVACNDESIMHRDTVVLHRSAPQQLIVSNQTAMPLQLVPVQTTAPAQTLPPAGQTSIDFVVVTEAQRETPAGSETNRIEALGSDPSLFHTVGQNTALYVDTEGGERWQFHYDLGACWLEQPASQTRHELSITEEPLPIPEPLCP